MSPHRVHVVGAGWAGLAAAVRLQSAGIPVTLIEQSRLAGGRARPVRWQGQALDNGQHLLLGACSGVQRLLHLAGQDPDRLFKRSGLALRTQDDAGKVRLELRIPPRGGALARLGSLLRIGGQPDSIAGLLLAMRRIRRTPGASQTVDGWLQSLRQPEWLSRSLWRPLCLAALNTPSNQASAEVFSKVLNESLFGARGCSDLLLPNADLNATVAAPLLRHLETQAGFRGDFGRRVDRLTPDHAGVHLLRRDGSSILVRRLVLAVPVSAAANLLAGLPDCAGLARTLADWRHNAITTIYLGWPHAIEMPVPLLGLLDGPAEWLVHRAHCGQPHLLAAVISADPGADTEQDREAALMAQLRRHLPELPAPAWVKPVREARAGFHCDPATQARRPGSASPHPGLWLAGDYTDTGLPATLEGAVRSGLAAAEAVLADIA